MPSYTYDTLKLLAQQTNRRISELLAMAPKNDPFYVGSPGQQQKAHWFADLWSRFGYTSGVHLRRVHYRLVSQDPPLNRPDGEPYQNTEAHWNYLIEAGKAARYLGLVKMSAFIDQRNKEIQAYAPNRRNTYDPECYWPTWRSLTIDYPDWPDLPNVEIDFYTQDQPYLVEIWCEKTTMDDILVPLCRHYRLNYQTGQGELSLTNCHDFARRVERLKKPAVILYVSDFDPAGYGMPLAIARKVEYFTEKHNLPPITLQPIALTPQQATDFNLPRTPIKPTELRKANFEATFGRGATELDALEALHPGELQRIVTAEIERYIDPDLDDNVDEARQELRHAADWQRALRLIPFANQLADLQDQFDSALADFQEATEPITDELNELTAQINDVMEETPLAELDDHPIPEPRDPDPFPDPLFDSDRGYFQQLDHYKAYRENGTNA